jgi:hypothetical protein
MPRVVTARRLSAALLALAAAVSLAACGNRHETITQADTEGLYLDVGGLTYQVQVSRELNAADIEDQAYIKGLPPGTPALKPTESWFGVFLRVTNEENHPIQAASDFRITNTQYQEGKPCLPINGCYRAVLLDPRSNPFAYTSTQLDPGEVYPPLSSAAEQGVVGGSVLVFRIPYGSYENRPLELHVRGADVPQRTGTVQLDL